MTDYIKALLILGSLISFSRAIVTGCARYDKTNEECKICDFMNFYAPDGNKGCVLKQIVGCEQPDAAGGCFRCGTGRYYEPTTKTCLIANTIVNCKNYLTATTCSVCFSGSYLSNNVCLKVPTENLITHCNAYASATKCSECRDNYSLSHDNTSCIEKETVGCSKYRNYNCKKCDLDVTFQRKESYLLQLQIDNLSVATRLRNKSADTLVTSVCMPILIDNCSTVISFDKCYQCDSGYYLTDDSKCQHYIYNDMPGCIEFESEEVCLACINGFYVSDSVCVESTDVDNCSVYDGHEDACIECEDTHYLSEGACVLRTNDVTHCNKKNIGEDNCDECAEGYQIDETKLVCIELPENCAEYASVDADTGDVTCGLCADTYYLNGNVCTSGTVEFCQVYNTNDDICETCQTGYVLNENECLEITQPIDNCLEHETGTPLSCKTCDSTSFKFIQSSICEAYADIPFCTSFLDLNTCEVCELGYNLEENSCVKIPEEEHCLKKESGDCVLCTETYELFDDVCIPVPDQVLANCALADPETVGIEYSCIGCAPNHIPFQHHHSVCLLTENYSITEISECDEYNFSDDEYHCIRCSPNYALSFDGSSCVETCPEGQVKYMGYINFDENEDIESITYAKCMDNDDFDDLPEGCLIASHSLKDIGNVCLQCASDYIPIEACGLDNTFFDTNDLSALNPGQAFSVVSCVAMTESTVFVPSSVSPDPNCKHYYPNQDRYYCKQCEFGMTGVIEVDGLGNYYVNCNTAVAGCDTDVKLGSGFVDDSWLGDMYGFSLTYAFTCHKCSDSNQIPFIHLDDNTNLKSYQLNADDSIPSEADTLDGEMTVCRAPTAEGLGISADNFDGFVENCALGAIIVDLPKSVSTDLPSVRCLACKDGFRSKLDDSNFYIASCEPIENCDSNPASGWFEGCQVCQEGSAAVLDENNKIDVSVCSFESVSANCILANDDSSCAVCDKNHYYDQDDKCVALSVPHCPDFVEERSLYFKLSNDTQNFSHAYYYGIKGFGCTTCSENHTAVTNEFDRPVCAEHPDLDTQSSQPETNYIDNCSMYFENEGDLLCRECSGSYIINDTNDQCFDNNGFTGCKVLSADGSNCNECIEGYMQIITGCVELNIENCTNYTYVIPTLTCNSCESGYKLVNNECIEGDIANCGVYAEDGSCQSCKDDHYLLVDTCLPIPSGINCKSVTLESSEDLIFNCLECPSGYKLNDEVTAEDHAICIQGPLVDNCIEYDDSYDCAKCESTHYLSENECIERTNILDNCNIYDDNEDECLRCVQHFLLKDNECIEVLNSVEHCIEYYNETTCSKCTSGLYIDNNECIDVPEDQLVENCEDYNGPGDCASCVDTHIIRPNGTCEEKQVFNCNLYSRPNACATCPSGYSMVYHTTDGFRKECEPFEIENCVEINSTSGQCSICATGYYPTKSKSCAEVTTTIENCKIYDTATTCKVCELGTVRSVDQLSCTASTEIAAIEPNCLDLQYLTKPECAACSAGYVIASKDCLVCDVTVKDGCLYCNASNHAECLMCRPGYDMGDESNCLVGQAAIQAIESDEDEGVGVLGTFGFMVALLMVFLR